MAPQPTREAAKTRSTRGFSYCSPLAFRRARNLGTNRDWPTIVAPSAKTMLCCKIMHTKGLFRNPREEGYGEAIFRRNSPTYTDSCNGEFWSTSRASAIHSVLWPLSTAACQWISTKLVERSDCLPGLPAVIQRLEWRRHRRSCRYHLRAQLHPGTRRKCDLAEPTLRFAQR